MGPTVLDCFPNLLNSKINERLDAGLKLLQHLHREAEENEESKELNHVLNRLVRGLGSSKPCSRKGFYSTLTVYLILNPNTKIEKIFNIMDIELKTCGSNSKSEVADINNGRILACGAIIRSKILKNCSADEQKRVLECMINSGKKRSYLSFESTSFIVEFLHQLDDENLLKPIWSVLEEEICKPFSEQNLDTFYTVLVVKNKFPGVLNKKILKKCFGNENIINEESIGDILKILTDVPRIICTKHPIYSHFCKELVETDYVEQFWLGIDQLFLKPSKTAEHLGVELLNILLENIKNKSRIPDLLSPNFLKHMLKRFSSDPVHRNDDVGSGFKKALSQLVKVLNKEVKAKLHLSVLKKLILHPGDVMIEKITGTKVIQMITNNLSADGVKKLSNLYREIAVNTKFKDKENWTNAERSYAVQLLSFKLMSHPEMMSEDEWRIDQLKFLFEIGLCEASNIGVELVGHFKESFYRALDNKLPKLEDLRTILCSLITHINESVFQSSELKLRTPFDESSTEAWKKMVKLMKKIEKESSSNEKVAAVFHVMNLHMGLQLFSDSEMAISSINELQSCFEHFQAKNKTPKKNKIKEVSLTEDLEWVEVVVELLLSLLSRNSHLLRSLVGCVFPHICPFLTPSAIHAILSILDVKSGKNPLSSSKDAEESESDLESDEEEENEEEEDNSDDEMNGKLEEESDSDEESEDDEEDDTVTDRLRLAVSQALGDAPMQTDDEDVDVDNINEEEGKRLDESLAAAFRILKENRKAQTKKQEKKAQTLTHFRIRVIDLLEIYLETGPSMTLALDMLMPLFTLLEFSIKDPHQKPLKSRVRSCLKKLSNVKKFKSIEGVDEEILITLLKSLIEKGERSASVCQEMGDKLAECCVFLVRCSQQSNIPSDNFIKVFGENLTAFFKKRDCVLPAILFKNLLQLCWIGNWYLAPLIVHFAFDDSIRSYRRGQALEFLTAFYNNVRMITSDDSKDQRLEMEKNLSTLSINLLQELSDSQTADNGQMLTNVGKGIKQKYICHLFQLLFKVHPHHIPEAWDWKKLGESMANYRSSVSLANDAKHAYNKLAMRIKVPVVCKKQKNEKIQVPNGNPESESDETTADLNQTCNNSIDSSDKVMKKKDKKKKKKNSHTMEKHKLKKEAQELRAKAMSEGLDSFDFSSVNIPNGISDNDDLLKNGNTIEDEIKTENIKKRHQLNTSEIPSKKKKKNVQSGD